MADEYTRMAFEQGQEQTVGRTAVKSTRWLLRQFITYITHPVYLDAPQVANINGLLLWRLFKLSYGLTLLTGALSTITEQIAAYLTDESFKQVHDRSNKILFALLVVVFAPLIEECIFRLSLRLTPARLSSTVASLCLFITNYHWQSVPDVWGKALLAGIGLLISLGTYVYANNSPNFVKLHQWWRLNFRIIFYASVFFFGLAHLSNVPSIGYKQVLLAPFVTLPQLTMGATFGYARMTYGFWYGVLLHAMTNSVGAILTFLL